MPDLIGHLTSTRYTDYNIHPGKNYYAVKAINDAGTTTGYAFSNEIALGRPSTFNASVSGSRINCSWSKVSGATGYQIFTSSSSYGTYTLFHEDDNGNSTSASIYYPAATGTTVYLKIRACYRPKYGEPIYSDYSSYKMVKF